MSKKDTKPYECGGNGGGGIHYEIEIKNLITFKNKLFLAHKNGLIIAKNEKELLQKIEDYQSGVLTIQI